MAKWLEGVLVLVLALVIAVPVVTVVKDKLRAPGSDSTQEVAGTAVGEENAALRPTEPQERTPPPQPVMTRGQFDRIRPGMAYEECVTVIGMDGTPLPPHVCQAKGLASAYTWLDPEGQTMFELGFRDGHLVARGFGAAPAAAKKAAAALKAQQKGSVPIEKDTVRQLEQAARQSGRVPVVTCAELDQIRPGMTYDECVAIIGASNPMADQYAGPRQAALGAQPNGSNKLEESYKWANPGGYYAEITFVNGRVTATSWKKGDAGSGGSARGSGGGAPRR